MMAKVSSDFYEQFPVEREQTELLSLSLRPVTFDMDDNCCGSFVHWIRFTRRRFCDSIFVFVNIAPHLTQLGSFHFDGYAKPLRQNVTYNIILGYSVIKAIA